MDYNPLMITDADIKKMKKVFATKDDLKNFATNFATKEDIKYLKNEIIDTRKDLNEKIDQVFLRLAEDIGNVMMEVKGSNTEIRTHRIQIGEHEDRLQKVEHKVFPQQLTNYTAVVV